MTTPAARAAKPMPALMRELIGIATPLVLSTASFTVMHFIDRVMLAWYSDVTAAASVCGGILAFMFISFFLGVAEYTNTFVAQYHGAGDRRMVSVSVWQGVYVAVVSGLLLLALKPVGLRVIEWFGHEAPVRAAERAYFSIMVAGGIWPLVNCALSSFFSGRGDTWTVMWVNTGASFLNGVLNYFLIFGSWGAPELGIRGAAYATVISSATGTAVYFVLLMRRRWRIEYGMQRYWAPRFRSLLQLVRYGGPSGVSFGLDIAAFTVFVLLMGTHGTVQLIASNITLSINMLAFMPMLGCSIGTSIMVGQYIGRNDKETAERAAYAGLRLTVGYMIVMGTLFLTVPRVFFMCFKGTGIAPDVFVQVVAYGRVLLAFLAVMGVLDAVNTTCSGALKGAGDTWFTMWAQVVIAWVVFVPPVWLMLRVWHMGINWAWAWLLVYVACLAITFALRFRRGRWKTIEIRETPTPPLVPEIAEEARMVE